MTRAAADTAARKEWDRLRRQLQMRRIALGLTQERAADLAGVGRRDLSKIECGERPPGTLILIKLLLAYGLPLPGVDPAPPASAGRPH